MSVVTGAKIGGDIGESIFTASTAENELKSKQAVGAGNSHMTSLGRAKVKRLNLQHELFV